MRTLGIFVADHIKAILAGVLAGLGTLRADLPHGVTGQEWIDVAVAAIVGTGVVYAIPNRDSKKRGEHRRPSPTDG